MTSLFSKPKAPDTSKQEALLASQDAAVKQREADAKRKDAMQAQGRKAARSGRASLITGAETGVLRTTLG